MATDKTSASPREAIEQQDHSIKERKSSLFDEPESAAGAARPFAEYLKTVPPAPLSPAAKASLIAAAAVVVLVLLGALLGGHGRKAPRGRRASAAATAVEGRASHDPAAAAPGV